MIVRSLRAVLLALEVAGLQNAPQAAVVVGIFFHISTVILFESTENHKFNIKKFGVIVLGFLISYLSL